MDNETQMTNTETAAAKANVRDNLIKLRSAYRTGQGNKKELINLVAAAMGNRSQRAFALDVGVNVSSVSRILSGNVSEISDKLLANIAAYAAPGSGVTIEKLMAAQGMVVAENRNDLEKKIEDNCRRILADELLKRGYMVSYREELPIEFENLCDFGIKTDALPKGGGLWLLEVKTSPNLAQTSNRGEALRNWVDRAMAAYYRGERIGRISMIVDDLNIFCEIEMILAKNPIRDEISVILVSAGAGSVRDEFVAPLKDGRLPEFTFSTENQ